MPDVAQVDEVPMEVPTAAPLAIEAAEHLQLEIESWGTGNSHRYLNNETIYALQFLLKIRLGWKAPQKSKWRQLPQAAMQPFVGANKMPIHGDIHAASANQLAQFDRKQ